MNKKQTKVQGERKFMTGESRYCQNCGKESYKLFEVSQSAKMKNKLQYCKKCFDSNKS
jgi:hypothetical protein